MFIFSTGIEFIWFEGYGIIPQIYSYDGVQAHFSSVIETLLGAFSIGPSVNIIDVYTEDAENFDRLDYSGYFDTTDVVFAYITEGMAVSSNEEVYSVKVGIGNSIIDLGISQTVYSNVNVQIENVIELIIDIGNGIFNAVESYKTDIDNSNLKILELAK